MHTKEALALILIDVERDSQSLRIKHNKEDNHTKDAFFEFNLKQRIR